MLYPPLILVSASIPKSSVNINWTDPNGWVVKWMVNFKSIYHIPNYSLSKLHCERCGWYTLHFTTSKILGMRCLVYQWFCSDLNENGPHVAHMFECLVPAGRRTVGEGLVGIALLGEVCWSGWLWGFKSLTPNTCTISSIFFLCLIPVNFQLFLSLRLCSNILDSSHLKS